MPDSTTLRDRVRTDNRINHPVVRLEDAISSATAGGVAQQVLKQVAPQARWAAVRLCQPLDPETVRPALDDATGVPGPLPKDLRGGTADRTGLTCADLPPGYQKAVPEILPLPVAPTTAATDGGTLVVGEDSRAVSNTAIHLRKASGAVAYHEPCHSVETLAADPALLYEQEAIPDIEQPKSNAGEQLPLPGGLNGGPTIPVGGFDRIVVLAGRRGVYSRHQPLYGALQYARLGAVIVHIARGFLPRSEKTVLTANCLLGSSGFETPRIAGVYRVVEPVASNSDHGDSCSSPQRRLSAYDTANSCSPS